MTLRVSAENLVRVSRELLSLSGVWSRNQVDCLKEMGKACHQVEMDLSVASDADTCDMEELEAASEVMDRAWAENHIEKCPALFGGFSEGVVCSQPCPECDKAHKILHDLDEVVGKVDEKCEEGGFDLVCRGCLNHLPLPAADSVALTLHNAKWHVDFSVHGGECLVVYCDECFRGALKVSERAYWLRRERERGR